MADTDQPDQPTAGIDNTSGAVSDTILAATNPDDDLQTPVKPSGDVNTGEGSSSGNRRRSNRLFRDAARAFDDTLGPKKRQQTIAEDSGTSASPAMDKGGRNKVHNNRITWNAAVTAIEREKTDGRLKLSGVLTNLMADQKTFKRNAELRVEANGMPKSINFSRPVNGEATLMQMTGDTVHKLACKKCAGGSGTFKQCITHSTAGRGACANCHMNSMGADCSFRSRETPQKPAPTPVLPVTDTEGHQSPSRKGKGKRNGGGKKTGPSTITGTDIDIRDTSPQATGHSGRTTHSLYNPALPSSQVGTSVTPGIPTEEPINPMEIPVLPPGEVPEIVMSRWLTVAAAE
ncbi:hypothetical protein B0H67DRAFT_122740 [Lasiosphaeris hirsuta]|uniref:Uncharacterized protein n=1 Tax=Lasiosphaeris hirsuta TaxID=260670 RepID=A0AA40B026_9PEZI|nr:hypothetical protein B0H67DRAFT_122740 [Lasiosphaeris hirsuta]